MAFAVLIFSEGFDLAYKKMCNQIGDIWSFGKKCVYRVSHSELTKVIWVWRIKKNMQVIFCLKALKFSGSDIWVSSASFQKSNIGWPQQPPTAKLIFTWLSWFIQFFFQNIKIKKISPKYIELKSLDDSEVLSSGFEDLKTSLISAASTTSLASPASKALFYQGTSWSWWLDHSYLAPNWPKLVLFCEMSHKK